MAARQSEVRPVRHHVTFLAIAFARARGLHANAMIAQSPGLEEIFAATNAAYDELLEREDVEFHLAYGANLEATSTPLFKMVFDERRQLFEGGDERVGTLLPWLVLAGFEKHVPREDRHVTTSDVGPSGLWLGELSGRLPVLRRRGRRPSMLSHVPGRDLRRRRHHLRGRTTMRPRPLYGPFQCARAVGDHRPGTRPELA